MKDLRKFKADRQILIIGIIVSMQILSACTHNKMTSSKSARLITLDPGHFHAALVQKTMYSDVDSIVHVYAPEGNDLRLHLERVNSYNTRSESPTHWKEEVYTGSDFFEKMIAQNKARPKDETGRRNVVVLSGNNLKKTDYILNSLTNGLNVYADKPMAIDNRLQMSTFYYFEIPENLAESARNLKSCSFQNFFPDSPDIFLFHHSLPPQGNTEQFELRKLNQDCCQQMVCV